jgi:branched-chain amino acid transport system permease protein
MPAFPKKWLIVLLLLAVIVPLLQPLVPNLVSDYRLFLVSTMIIASIAVLGLNLLTGFNGQISLGHGAFYAVGAYTAAVLMDQAELPYWATLPVAAAVCFIVGYLFGLPALKLEGHYLALATFALALAVPQILKYKWLEGLTGGVQGIVLSKPEVPFGLPLSEDQWLYYYCLAVMVVLYWAAHNILRSRSGRAMMAIRDYHIAADTMGIDTALYKTVTFGISAAYTGIAGALSASAIAFVAPDSFGFFLSIKFLIGLVVGGIGSLAGSVVGGIFYVLVDNSAQALSIFIKNDLGLQFDLSAYTVFGVLLIGLMYLMPTGIVGGVYLVMRRLSRAGGARPPTEPAAPAQPVQQPAQEAAAARRAP